MELILIIVVGDLWKLIRWNCFLLFFLKCVFVWVRLFSITVAWTSTSSFCTIGRPIKEKSLDPTTRTLSNRILSPISGCQKPSTSMISPAVILNCLPAKCTTAKSLPASSFWSWLLTCFKGLRSSDGLTNGLGLSWSALASKLVEVENGNFNAANRKIKDFVIL